MSVLNAVSKGDKLFRLSNPKFNYTVEKINTNDDFVILRSGKKTFKVFKNDLEDYDFIEQADASDLDREVY